MPYTRQTNAQRGGRGRGRGRGRGGNRPYKKYKNEKPVQKKFIEKCPFIVGTPEWAKWREARSDYTPQIFVGSPVDPEFIPRITKVNSNKENIDAKMADIQQEMIDNKWSLREFEDGEFFTHYSYPNKRVHVHNHVAIDGRVFKLPIIDRDDDPLGLGCCFTYTPPNLYYSIMSNRYKEYGESRSGKRRENYLNYLARRLKRKEEFQKEAEAIAKAMEVKKRQMNKAKSTV